MISHGCGLTCCFVGIPPGICGLVSSGCGINFGLKSTISGRILKRFPGTFSLAELWSDIVIRRDVGLKL